MLLTNIRRPKYLCVHNCKHYSTYFTFQPYFPQTSTVLLNWVKPAFVELRDADTARIKKGQEEGYRAFAVVTMQLLVIIERGLTSEFPWVSGRF